MTAHSQAPLGGSRASRPPSSRPVLQADTSQWLKVGMAFAHEGMPTREDGKLVVDHDGLHAPEVKTGFAPLARGPHEVVIGWFNRTGDARLDMRWGLAGTILTPARDALQHR